MRKLNKKFNNVLKYLSYCFFYMILFFIFSEIALRIIGYRPYQDPKSVNISVEPGNRFYTKHPKLGYIHLPGKFKVNFDRTTYSFNVTHLGNSLRITHPLNTYDSEYTKKEIWIFGCSITHGWSVNDNETYPWLIQEKFPDYEILNFGACGYGTIHSLIQLKEALKKQNKPELVIVAYAPFHDRRNIFSRRRRKIVVSWNRLGPLVQPYARLDRNGALHYYMADVVYQEWPLMRYSAFVHFLEKIYNRIEEYNYKNHKVSKALIKEISQLCLKNGIKFVVAGIRADSLTSDMLKCCKNQGIMAIDISIGHNKRTINYPYDNFHPSPLGHKEYTRKLSLFLNTILDD